MMLFSFGKLLVLGAVCFWLWRTLTAQPSRPADAPPPAAPEGPKPAAFDLDQCPKCGSYVATANGRGCSRPDCPMLP